MSDTHVSGDMYAKGIKLTGNPRQAAVANVASANSVAAAGSAPTKAEFDAVVAEANETKAQLNAVLAALRAAGIIVSS